LVIFWKIKLFYNTLLYTTLSWRQKTGTGAAQY